MRAAIAGFNATIVANMFNPSVFRESWLTANGVIRADELEANFVFSDQAAHVPTARFVLTVVPPQLQFAPVTREAAAGLVNDVLIPMIQRIPHTPMRAIGVNFLWTVDPEEEAIERLTRRLFLPAQLPLATAFADANSKFGCYMSKDVGNVRLKLDMKPRPPTTVGSRVDCSFNFHRDLTPDDAANQANEVLRRWAELDQLAEEMMTTLNGGQL